MTKSGQELLFLSFSFLLLVGVITLLLANVDVIELLFKTKVDNRLIGY